MRAHIGTALLALAAGNSAAGDPINIMWFGNSHTCGFGPACTGSAATVEPGVPAVVRLIARYAGDTEPTNYWRTVNGASIIAGFADASTRVNDVPEGAWDFVVIQGNAGETLPVIGNPGRFVNVASCVDFVYRTHSPGIVSIYFQTWARAHEHPDYAAQGGLIADPPTAHRTVRDAYQDGARRVEKWAGIGTARVAPVGDAMAAADWNNDAGSPEAVISLDNNHATNRGSLTASLVLYATIFERTDLVSLGLDVAGDTSELAQRLRGLGINQADWDYAVSLAEQAVNQRPFGCTPSDLAAPFGVSTLDDYAAFFDAFQAGAPRADINGGGVGDGEHDFFDVLECIESYQEPCSDIVPPCPT